MTDLNKSSYKFLDTAFGASVWALNLLIHVVLISLTILVIYIQPDFPSDIGEQARNARTAINAMEGKFLYEDQKSRFAPSEYKAKLFREDIALKKFLKDQKFQLQLKGNNYFKLLEIDDKIQDINYRLSVIYEDIIDKECPDCHLSVWDYHFDKPSYEYGSLASAENLLDKLSTLSKNRLFFWFAVGRLAQVALLAALVFLTFHFWKAKKQGLLNWGEKFLFLLSPMLLLSFVIIATTNSVEYYMYPSDEGMPLPFFKGNNFSRLLIFGILGLFILTPAAWTMRKHRKANAHESMELPKRDLLKKHKPVLT